MAVKPELAGAAMLMLGVAATAPSAYADGTISACGATITAAGDYAVTTNLTSSSDGDEACVKINASDVGIDLQGHMITATEAASGGTAIGTYAGGARNIIIANGTIQGFYNAIALSGTVHVTIAKMNLIENNLALSAFGDDVVVIDSQANNNERGGMHFHGANNIVVNSQANNNHGEGYGMSFTASNNTVINSQANGNQGSGIDISGPDNLLSGDTANDNKIGISVVCRSNLFGNSAHGNPGGDIVTSGSPACTRLDNAPAP
jgi:hypothetical protein